MNITTIYRNLDELVRQGVVDRSYLGGGTAAYHLASGGHAHLFCEQCGAMTEVPSGLFRGVTETLATRYGFAVGPHRLGTIGRCAGCRRHDADQYRSCLPADSVLSGIAAATVEQPADPYALSGLPPGRVTAGRKLWQAG